MKKQIKLKVEIGNHSDVGQVRKINQDQFGSASNARGDLYVVADGMGGHQGGEIASQMTVNSLCKSFKESFHDNPRQFLQNGIMEVNQQVLAKAEEDPTLKGMGTTIVAVIIYDGDAYYAHVGDSRIYLFRQHKSKQLTKDHSFVQQLVDQGIITEKEAETHPEKNRILQAVGIENITPDYSTEKLYKGDTLLLCSDGLTGLADDGDILKIIGKYSAMEASKELVEIANNRGGHDNITTIVIKVKKGPRPPQPQKPKRDMKDILPQMTIRKWGILLAGLFIGIILTLAVQDATNRIKKFWNDDIPFTATPEESEVKGSGDSTNNENDKDNTISHEKPDSTEHEQNDKKNPIGSKQLNDKEKDDKKTKEN